MKLKSDFLNNPRPAGLIPMAEKSAPIAPNEPVQPRALAVPMGLVKLIRKASAAI